MLLKDGRRAIKKCSTRADVQLAVQWRLMAGNKKVDPRYRVPATAAVPKIIHNLQRGCFVETRKKICRKYIWNDNDSRNKYQSFSPQSAPIQKG